MLDWSELTDVSYKISHPCSYRYERNFQKYKIKNLYGNIQEEPLPAGGSCLLGSINLSEFVTENKTFDFDEFRRVVNISVKALNDVLDEGLPLHPLKEQRESVRDWRQIGLGIFGLADLLIKMEIKYGSEKSIDLCDMIGHAMADEALKTSAELAKETTSYPKYNGDAILSSAFI